MCHVVPSEGPKIRTGASSGPSKRYCRVFDGVSLTPQTLSRLTKSHTAGGSRRLDAPVAPLGGPCRRPSRSSLSLSACTRAPDAAWPAGRALARSSRRRAASFISTAASCSEFAAKHVVPSRRWGRRSVEPLRSAPDNHHLGYAAELTRVPPPHRVGHP